MKYILSSCIVLFTLSVSAQKITLVNATSRSWAGGQAGHSGCNYNITLTVSDTTIIPDTLWLGKSPYPLNFKKSSVCSRSYSKKHHIMTYYFMIGTSYVYPINPKYVGDDGTNRNDTIKVKPPAKQYSKQYEGAVLISYRYKGQEHDFIVKQFKVLPGICYP